MTVTQVVTDIKKIYSRIRLLRQAQVEDPIQAALTTGMHFAEMKFLSERLPSALRSRMWVLLSLERAA